MQYLVFSNQTGTGEHLRIIRKKERDINSGVIRASNMEVPEIPPSYRLTGARKTVAPKALIRPEIVSITKLRRES